MALRWWHWFFGHTKVVDLGASIKAGVILGCADCGMVWAPAHDQVRVR